MIIEIYFKIKVNFDKLRKLAKGVRSIVHMTASSFVSFNFVKKFEFNK